MSHHLSAAAPISRTPASWLAAGIRSTALPRRRPSKSVRYSASPAGASTGQDSQTAGPASPVEQQQQQQQSNIVPGSGAATAASGRGVLRKDAFSWEQQWYPLAPLSYLSASKPTPYTVLGRRLVVWFHGPSQQWRVMEDRCPHRLVPLSEGRIEPASGNLQCSYHGWVFGPEGQCTTIPQADSLQQEASACASGRSCVTTFPVRQEQGLLWVWMDPNSSATSQLRPLPLPADLQMPAGATGKPKGTLLGGWYQRDLPVSAEYLLENLLDPAHVHFAHRGVIGSPSRAGSIPLQQEGPLTAQGGFQLSMARQWQGRAQQPQWQLAGMKAPPSAAAFGSDGIDSISSLPGLENITSGDSPSSISSGTGVPATTRFVPPGLVWLEFSAGGAQFSMLFYTVPVSAGSSRIIAGYTTDALPPVVQAALQSDVLAPVLHAFQFLSDLGSHEVLDGDAVHIYHQERQVRQEGKRAYYMPTSSDKGVVLLRRWLDEFAGGGPQYGSARGKGSTGTGGQAATPGRQLSRQEILDRYEQHTRHCPSCRRALGVTRALRRGLELGSASAFGAAFTLALARALLPSPGFLLPPPFGRAGLSAPLLLGIAGLLAGAAQQALAQLERRFLFVDYTHWDRE